MGSSGKLGFLEWCFSPNWGFLVIARHREPLPPPPHERVGEIGRSRH